jgi:hypothetical protein
LAQLRTYQYALGDDGVLDIGTTNLTGEKNLIPCDRFSTLGLGKVKHNNYGITSMLLVMMVFLLVPPISLEKRILFHVTGSQHWD